MLVRERLGWRDPHEGALGLAGREAHRPASFLTTHPPVRPPAPASGVWALCLGACFMAQTQNSQLFLLLAALIASPPSSAEI